MLVALDVIDEPCRVDVESVADVESFPVEVESVVDDCPSAGVATVPHPEPIEATTPAVAVARSRSRF